MKTVVCPGSFDPVTNGHLDIIERAAALFDKVIVVVMVNASKTPLFTTEQRVDMLRRSTAHLENVTVDSYDGLLAAYARQQGATVIVKGLRALSDFEYEFQMALTNRQLNEELETVFLTATDDKMYLSSSLVKQVAAYGEDVSKFVPACILQDITEKFGKDG
ncbi:MAG: pantetheine-phosphate adenylyltransferase [Ruminococcaceae bacterium]|nr:pantetheine-phosphate adenylyltransferase [Oscillospiraceae bacterium]